MRQDLVDLWLRRIEEINQTGNVMVNPHSPSKYFSDQGKQKYTKEEMIAYCRKKIEIISNSNGKFDKPLNISKNGK